MKNIFTGFILIFLDFNLNISNSQIGLIPDFLGYIIMIRGLEEMARESMLFIKAKPYAIGMAVYSGILYFLNLLGVSSSLGALSYLLALISVAVSLYISYHIVMGVKDLEGKYHRSYNGDKLKSTWSLLAIVHVLTFLLSLLPAVAIIFIILSFIVTIYFLVEFNKSKNLYYENHFY